MNDSSNKTGPVRTGGRRRRRRFPEDTADMADNTSFDSNMQTGGRAGGEKCEGDVSDDTCKAPEGADLANLKGALRNRLASMAADPNQTLTAGAISQLLSTLEKVAPDDQADRTVNIVTRFPPIGAAESDYQQYALVERAESLARRVEQLEHENTKLADALENRPQREEPTEHPIPQPPQGPGVWSCTRCPSGTPNEPEADRCRLCGYMRDGSLPPKEKTSDAGPGVGLTIDAEEVGFWAG